MNQWQEILQLLNSWPVERELIERHGKPAFLKYKAQLITTIQNKKKRYVC